MMIMIMKTSGSQVDSPVTEGNRKEGGGRENERARRRELAVHELHTNLPWIKNQD